MENPTHSRRRDAAIDFVDHSTNNIAKLFDHGLVPRQSVSLGVIENESIIWIADIVKCNVTVEIRVQRANWELVSNSSLR